MKINGEKDLFTAAQVNKLQKEIDRLKKSVKEKKFGLVWMDVPEKFNEECENKLPILKEIPEKAVINKDGKPTHILIEGDNYHALTCLNYTHKGKIDVIYIDPPYNTGAKDWKYNNKYVEENDPWRHSKWVSMMKKRLELSKYLLKKEGVLIVTIDDNESCPLGLLLEEIFACKERATVVIKYNPAGTARNGFSRNHEYAYFLLNPGQEIEKKSAPGDVRDQNLRRHGTGANRQDSPTMFYPIYIDKISLRVIGAGDVPEKNFHPQKQTIDRGKFYEIWPIDDHNKEKRWYYGKERVKSKGADELICKWLKDRLHVYFHTDNLSEQKYQSVWIGSEYDAGAHGGSMVRDIVGQQFPFPKSLYAVKDCLNAIVKNNKKAIVLDYFAGSGTTAHAVMEMNKDDGGNRQFIMCTNNENKICEEIAYPRIEKVINGYPFEGKDKELLYEQKITVTSFRKANDILAEIEFVKLEKQKGFTDFEIDIEDNHIKLFGIKDINGKKEGLGGSLKYYKTAFIGKNNILKATDEDKIELAHQAGDLLALAENTLYKVRENKFWQLYKNGERHTAVYFREELDKFDEFVEMVEKLKCPVTVYVFSWGDEEFEDEFEHIDDVKVKTIPLPILEIYKNIYSAG